MLWIVLFCIGLCLAVIGVFGLARSGIQFSRDKYEHTAEEVFAWLRTPGSLGGRPWMICMLIGYTLLLIMALVFFAPRMLPSASPSPSVSAVSLSPEPEASQTVEPELSVIDYAEILRHSEEYDGQEVRVAGRISRLGYDTNKQSFYFSDRLGFLESSYFQVRLSRGFRYNEGVSDYYSINQYVLVQGVWKSGRYACLNNAEVIATDQEAQAADRLFMDEWMREGQSYADLPITDYMDLVQFPERYLDQRVRTVGQVKVSGKNSATETTESFSFRSRDNSLQKAYYILRGCPPEMRALCVDGEYVILSCLVAENEWGQLWFSECFVECVGDEARALAEQSDAEWWNHFFDDRAAYITDCQQYSYDELARYPDSYTGKQIVLSGTVTQIIEGLISYTVHLDVDEGQIVYIKYSGKLPQDPEILEGDQVTFYGECNGRTSYETPLGESKTVPRVTARYSSFNQFYTSG